MCSYKLLFVLTVVLWFDPSSARIRSQSKVKVRPDGSIVSRTNPFLPFGLLRPGVQIIMFENVECKGHTHPFTGTCYTEDECNERGGIANGHCASGYGVCCVFDCKCGDRLTQDGSQFTNPGFMNPYNQEGECILYIVPTTKTTQLLIEFHYLTLMGAHEGDCTNDTLEVIGGKTKIPIICGENGGKHLYVNIKGTTGPYMIVVTTSEESFSRLWHMKVSFLTDFEPHSAPPNCLQYYTEHTGHISSFHSSGVEDHFLNEQDYLICFAQHPGRCQMYVEFTLFDVGVSEGGVCQNHFVEAHGDKYCGDNPGLNFNVDEPHYLRVFGATDSCHDGNCVGHEGFEGKYELLPC